MKLSDVCVCVCVETYLSLSVTANLHSKRPFLFLKPIWHQLNILNLSNKSNLLSIERIIVKILITFMSKVQYTCSIRCRLVTSCADQPEFSSPTSNQGFIRWIYDPSLKKFWLELLFFNKFWSKIRQSSTTIPEKTM